MTLEGKTHRRAYFEPSTPGRLRSGSNAHDEESVVFASVRFEEVLRSNGIEH